MEQPPEPIYTFQSRRGLTVSVRRVQPTDAAQLVDLFNHLSLVSRYQRFNQLLDEVPPERVWQEATRLAALEPAQGQLWLAFADLPEQPAAPVAGLRLQRIPPDAAEVALSVRDDLQGQGIARALHPFVLQQARVLGVSKLVALFHQSNQPVLALLERAPYPLRRFPHGEYLYVEMALPTEGV